MEICHTIVGSNYFSPFSPTSFFFLNACADVCPAGSYCPLYFPGRSARAIELSVLLVENIVLCRFKIFFSPQYVKAKGRKDAKYTSKGVDG